MTDIFDTTILCNNCNIKMQKVIVNKNGFELRAVQCPKCKDNIIHPADLNGFKDFNNLKGKTFNVKLRMVGNSHAISIPKEIVDFIQQQEKMMDNMMRLCFEDMHKISVMFGNEHDSMINEEDMEEDREEDNGPWTPRTRRRL